MKQITKIIILVLTLAMLALPVSADDTPYILDDAGLLTQEERTELNRLARQITETYSCAVYIGTVEDMRDYGYRDIFEFAYEVYHQMKLGYGEDREGMILMLSMDDRDFATFFYGDKTHYAFNSYGQEKLEGYFLNDLSRNRWYDGFRDYLEAVDSFLAKAQSGRPVRRSALPFAILIIVIAMIPAAVTTTLVWKKMNHVQRQSSAAHYTVAGSLNLIRQHETLVRHTTTRHRIESSSGSGSSGSRSRSGGGGSGRSGKF